MNVLIAPQSFKGSLDALGVARAMERGFRRVWPHHTYELLPIADGGEGTVEALVTATGGRILETQVEDPLGRPIQAEWGLLGDGRTAVIEMAAASGLPLLQRSERNPMVTSTYGTGQLIRAALDRGVKRLIIGIGGSATNDAGAGMAYALGVRFLDGHGRPLPRGGRALLRLAKIDTSRLDPRLNTSQIIVASDVTNPLCGSEGASHIYGPQKGATPQGVRVLDRALERFADVVKEDLNVDVRDVPGAGAAGGLGAGLFVFAGAEMRRGVDLIFSAMNVDARLDGKGLVVIGEGRMDGQDVYGKAPVAMAERASARAIPVVAIVGSIGQGYEAVYDHGVDAVLSIMPRPMSIERAASQAEQLICAAAERTARSLSLGAKLAIGLGGELAD